HIHILERSEQGDKKRPCRSLIIDDHDAEWGAHTATLSDAPSRDIVVTGRDTSTVVPCPGALTMESDAPAPYWPRSRRSTLRSPTPCSRRRGSCSSETPARV